MTKVMKSLLDMEGPIADLEGAAEVLHLMAIAESSEDAVTPSALHFMAWTISARTDRLKELWRVARKDESPGPRPPLGIVRDCEGEAS